ncbi:MAG: pyridoxamine 5'-phosphate oxidase family protein [Pseudomonadota bacterium]
MKIALDTIRHSLEGAIPGVVATCDANGIPNVSYVSQVHYVDSNQVALSFQFFNKTRGNMLANPQLTAYLIDPETVARYRLALLYLRTETDGPLFQNMKAKLAGIASHTGMAGVFELRGADVCRVLDIERVPGAEAPRALPPYNWLTVLRALGQRVAGCGDMAGLFEEVLGGLEEMLDIRHSLLLMWDECGHKLYTVASRGYVQSGIGSEIPLGCGVIGVAAQYQTPIRITHMATEYSYSKAVRENAGLDPQRLETAIPFPGLAEPHSQMALPLLASGRLWACCMWKVNRTCASVSRMKTACRYWRSRLRSPLCSCSRRPTWKRIPLPLRRAHRRRARVCRFAFIRPITVSLLATIT